MTDVKDGRFILASSSPRRRQLLSEAGFAFDVVDPTLDEPAPRAAEVDPAAHAEALAYYKARDVVDRLHPDMPVLAADTVVALDGRIYGKPADREDARRILSALAGTRHQVITGVALVDADGRRRIASAVTHVRMRPMSEDELGQYLAGDAWQGKAGAYGIQDEGDRFVERIEGSFSNVVGLPVELVREMFAKMSLSTPPAEEAP